MTYLKFYKLSIKINFIIITLIDNKLNWELTSVIPFSYKIYVLFIYCCIYFPHV